MSGAKDSAVNFAADQLKLHLEKIERLEAERQETADDIRAIYAEAKSQGFVPKAIREMVRRRKKDPAEVAQDETILDTYMHAVGMVPENPLAAAVSSLARDAVGRDQVIEALKKMVPLHGEIIAKVGGAPMKLWRGEDGVCYAAEYVETAPPAPKVGRSLGRPATVLTMVPRDPVKDAADAAEARAKATKPLGDHTDETDEPLQ